MLTTDRLREILTAAIDQKAGTYVDALQEHRILISIAAVPTGTHQAQKVTDFLGFLVLRVTPCSF